MSIADQIEEFLLYCEITKNRSPKTLQNYRHYLQRFDKFAGPKTTPAKIDLNLVQKYQLHLNRLTDKQGSPLSIKTKSYHIIALRAFLKYLTKNDIKTLAPEKVELPKIPKRTVEALSKEELDRLFNQVNLSKKNGKRDYAILITLYSTGLRVSELVSLNTNQVDLQRKEFMVRGKGQKPRIVFLSEKAAQAIQAYLQTREDTLPPLFTNNNTKQILEPEKSRLSARSIQNMVSKYSLQAGIIKKVTPHILRHSYATQLLINGADIRSVQELLGHSSITTTQVYTHLTDKKLREIHQNFTNNKKTATFSKHFRYSI